jgi:hypothetical protein
MPSLRACRFDLRTDAAGVERARLLAAVEGEQHRRHDRVVGRFGERPPRVPQHALQLAPDARNGSGERPGIGMRMPIELTSRTLRCFAARVISWKSLCARLWYHQSWPQKQIRSGELGTGSLISVKTPMTMESHRHPAEEDGQRQSARSSCLRAGYAALPRNLAR